MTNKIQLEADNGLNSLLMLTSLYAGCTRLDAQNQGELLLVRLVGQIGCQWLEC